LQETPEMRRVTDLTVKRIKTA